MKCKTLVTGIGACVALLLFSGMPSYAEEERVEPGVYKEREVLLELRQYKPGAEQREIRVPEEQKNPHIYAAIRRNIHRASRYLICE